MRSISEYPSNINMSNFVNLSIFENYQKYIDNEQEIREVMFAICWLISCIIFLSKFLIAENSLDGA